MKIISKVCHIYRAMGAELSFCELRTKMVINVIDGKALGRIVDIIFSRESSRVIGVVVPGDKCFRIFNKKGDIFIPYDKIVRIGIDVILAELRPFGISSDAHSPSILLN